MTDTYQRPLRNAEDKWITLTFYPVGDSILQVTVGDKTINLNKHKFFACVCPEDLEHLLVEGGLNLTFL